MLGLLAGAEDTNPGVRLLGNEFIPGIANVERADIDLCRLGPTGRDGFLS